MMSPQKYDFLVPSLRFGTIYQYFPVSKLYEKTTEKVGTLKITIFSSTHPLCTHEYAFDQAPTDISSTRPPPSPPAPKDFLSNNFSMHHAYRNNSQFLCVVM